MVAFQPSAKIAREPIISKYCTERGLGAAGSVNEGSRLAP
nr:hypothetical protein CPGR_04059 [Mycolicibacter nonchromogenicus]